jgi:hypothetical protein
MSDAVARTCEKTGLRLLRVRDERMYRIAETRFGAISAPERHDGADRTRWGRFDVPGRTIYTAERLDVAFAEVLSPFKRHLGEGDPLENDALALGLSTAEFLELVAADWEERSFMGVGAVPASWRHARGIYDVRAASGGWWIDMDHPDTLSRVERATASALIDEGIPELTLGVVTGENRRITTLISEVLRRAHLDDGTVARGLQFPSKWGGSWCRAIWLPAPNETWTPDLLELAPEPILVRNDDLARATGWFDIRAF